MDLDLDLIGKNRRPMHIIYAQRSVADPIYQTQQPSPARQRPDFGSFEFASTTVVSALLLLWRVAKAWRCFAPSTKRFNFDN